jgi:hypothetical protein
VLRARVNSRIGMMYHASSGTTKMAKKSMSFAEYFRLRPCGALHITLHAYESPSRDAVEAECRWHLKDASGWRQRQEVFRRPSLWK